MVGLEVEIPVCVFGLPVDGDVQAAIIFHWSRVSSKGRVPSFSSSAVNLMAGRTLLRWSRCTSTWSFFTMLHADILLPHPRSH